MGQNSSSKLPEQQYCMEAWWHGGQTMVVGWSRWEQHSSLWDTHTLQRAFVVRTGAVEAHKEPYPIQRCGMGGPRCTLTRKCKLLRAEDNEGM